MKKDDWGVHQTHCCFKHGCKYGYEVIQKECPVYAGKIKQEYPCESCENDSSIKLFFGCYIEVSNPIITDIETKKSQKKWCLNEDCFIDKKYGFNEKFAFCPFCKSDIDYKDIVKSQKFPTETNLDLKDDWEVVEVRIYPEIKKLYLWKNDLKSSVDTTLNVSNHNISVININDISLDFIETYNRNSQGNVSSFRTTHQETINILQKHFSNVFVVFGLISIPTNYFGSDDGSY